MTNLTPFSFHTYPMTFVNIHQCMAQSFSDRSPLLLCRKTSINDIRSLRTSLRSDEGSSLAPQCISARHLQIFRGKRFEYEGKTCNVHKGIWKPNKSTNMDVAIKFLKNQTDEKKMKVNAHSVDYQVCTYSKFLIFL